MATNTLGQQLTTTTMHNNKSIQSAAPEITWRRSPVAWAAAATMCREEKEAATIDEEEVKQCSLMAAAKHQKQKDVEAGANKHYNCVCANIFFYFYAECLTATMRRRNSSGTNVKRQS